MTVIQAKNKTKSITFSKSADGIQGQIEIKREGEEEYYTVFKINKGLVEVRDIIFERANLIDETIYKIRGNFCAEPDIIEVAVKKVERMLNDLNIIQAEASKNFRKISSKSLFIEITANRMYIKLPNIEVEIKNSKNKYLNDTKDFHEVIDKEEDKRILASLTYMMIMSQLNLLLPLSATIKMLAGVE